MEAFESFVALALVEVLPELMLETEAEQHLGSRGRARLLSPPRSSLGKIEGGAGVNALIAERLLHVVLLPEEDRRGS
jgi:hypothetical protein